MCSLGGQVISDLERDRLHREVLRTQGQITARSEYDGCQNSEAFSCLIRETKRLFLKDQGLWASIKSFSQSKTATLDR